MKPLRLYVADYDRALDADIETWSTLDQDDHDGWSEPDEEELRELRRERRLDEVEGRWMAGAPAETLDVLRRFRDEREAQLLGKAIVDQRPGRRDRPGPLTDLEAVARRIGLPPPGEPDAWELPGQFWLDIPPELSGRPRWASTVREQMAEHRGRWRVLPRQFERPLALDIAACGTGENTRDIDNLAHGVLTAFEELYCGGHRGTVVAYRAYRRQARRTGVRVQVLDDQTLHTLEDRIDKAREDTLRAGPTRDR